jgi:hypothetical protein
VNQLTPPLIAILVSPQTAELYETPLIGRPYVSFGAMLAASGWLFSMGAALGRIFNGKLDVLASLEPDAIPGLEYQRLWSDMSQTVAGKVTPGEVVSVRFIDEGYSRAGVHFPPTSDKEAKAVEEVASRKLPMDQAEERIRNLVHEGIAYGSTHPDEVPHIWQADLDAELQAWREAKEQGMDVGEPPETYTYDDIEDYVREVVAAYADQYYPNVQLPFEKPTSDT